MLIPVKKLSGTVERILVNGQRATSLASSALDQVSVGYDGFAGEDHGGLTRPSCSRVKLQYAEGTEIRNTRQITAVSVEELQKIADAMGVDRLEPEWVGANLLLSGIPDLTLLPPSTRLIFEHGVSLVVDMENGPCKFPGEIIDQYHPGRGHLFPKAAQHLRGILAWVEKTGTLTTGESVLPHLPRQPVYPHALS